MLRVDVTPKNPILGALLGAAVGDALGLPTEGLKAASIARRFEPLDRYRLLGRTGFVSDDTEQSVLIARALAGEPDDDVVIARFRRALAGWFWRLPFGIGLSTLRACLKLSLGLRRSGIHSAGNGAAMRAPVLGAALAGFPERRVALGRRLAEVTHTHPAGVEGALFCAELAAVCAAATGRESREDLVYRATEVVEDDELRRALQAAMSLSSAPAEDAAARLGTTGWVVHSVGVCVWAFLAHEGMEAVRAVIRVGGDTDTHGAIVGAWVGALHGPSAFPAELVENLQPGPFGRAHIVATANALTTSTPAPGYSAVIALLRNLSLYPVVLAHGLWRIVRR